MTLLTALLALTPTVAPAPTPAPVSQDLLSIFIESTDNLLKHPKDQAMRGALDLLGERLLELPGEIPDLRDMPAHLIPMVYDMVGSAKTIRIMDAREASSMIPVSALVMVDPGDQEKATLWMTTMEGLLRQAGAPVGARDAEGWLPFEGAPFPVRMGVNDGALVLAASEPTVGPLSLDSATLPNGIAPSFAARIDLGTALEMVMPMLEMAEPEIGGIVADVTGALRLDDFSMEMACGSDASKSYTSVVLPGFGTAMREMGALPAEGLTSADLKLIPADATMANIQSFDMNAMFDVVLDIAEPFLAEEGIEDPIAMVEGMTGVNIKRDLLDHLGTHMGSYFSDSTGGGGLMSMVMFMEVKDAEKLNAGIQRISGLINGVLAQEAEGYVQMRSIDRGGKTCHTLTFPGLPVPFEPTMVMGENNLFIALTPQAALVAAQMETGTGAGLMDNTQFATNFDGNYENLYGVSFFRDDAFMREGYGLTSLICSGLSNGVRSKMNSQRDAGLIMPTFPELMKNVRPTVGVTRVNEAGDFVTTMEGDPSFLVNMTRGVGYMVSNPTAWIGFIPAFAGIAEQNF
ncbi:MAG: hypothetical protein P1V35_07400 [Planctomycetota bacterium]|nr:hypothetical protein [Planctomycetota bacterium]